VIEMSPEAITERLVRMSELSRDAPSRARVDMSPEAVTQRLEMLSALSAMCLELVAVGAGKAPAAGS
jgi:hypothetical protein